MSDSVSRETLEQRLGVLYKDLQTLHTNLLMVQGAIKTCEQLIKDCDSENKEVETDGS